MNETISEVHSELIKKIAEENGFKNFTIEQYAKSARGDNYVGEILSIRIKENVNIFDIILKRAPSLEKIRKCFPVRDIFLHEIYLYDTVLTTFAKFQKENGLENIFDSYPKLYGKCDEEIEECLVLENLITNGYKHWNRKVPMNSAHISLVMKEYGKFHAVSFAMKKKNSDLFKNLREGFRKEDKAQGEKELEQFLKASSLGLEKAIKGNPVLEGALKRVMTDDKKYFFEEVSGSEEQLVFTHGDCWCNNMLFKYEDPNDAEKPTKVSLIDWQISKCASPLQDLVYFFYASSSKDILYDYERYLRIYYDSLSENLRQMSCDPEELFKFEELEKLWKKFGRYGLIIGGLVFNILYVDGEQAPQVDENVASVEDFFNQFGSTGHEEEVNQRITDLFEFMIKNNFI